MSIDWLAEYIKYSYNPNITFGFRISIPQHISFVILANIFAIIAIVIDKPKVVGIMSLCVVGIYAMVFSSLLASTSRGIKGQHYSPIKISS